MSYNWESLEDREKRLKSEMEERKRKREKEEKDRRKEEEAREARREAIMSDPDESMDEIGIVETKYWPEYAQDEDDYEIIEFECTKRESILLNEGFIRLVEIRGYRDAIREGEYDDDEVSSYDEEDGIVSPSEEIEEVSSSETTSEVKAAEETTIDPETIARASKDLPAEKVDGARGFFKRMLDRLLGHRR